MVSGLFSIGSSNLLPAIAHRRRNSAFKVHKERVSRIPQALIIGVSEWHKFTFENVEKINFHTKVSITECLQMVYTMWISSHERLQSSQS